ncbi:MAG: DUF11 domain-containing protein, partial [Thermoplasmata archaeon]|nr:DUF11 domain-containing protein [Thermoplasmata archaeon]
WKTGPDNATAGETIMYTVNYWNWGTDTATNVTITETYPVGSTFVNATPPPDVPTDNVWTIGDVPAGTGGVIFINITLDPNASGLLVNNVTLEYNNTANQTMPAVNATWITYLSGPYMQITKTAPPFANSGETIMYTITYQNIGNDTAYNVTITEFYPPEVTFVNATPPPDVGNNVWIIPVVPAGTGGVIFINVTIDANATGEIYNYVELIYENVAGVSLPIESANATTIIIDPLMTIDKTGPDFANPGETIMYTITYQNIGTDDAYNVNITEIYPPGVTYLNSTPLPTFGDNVWIIPVVPAGTGGVIFINVTIDVNATGTITNTVILQYEDQAGEAQDPVNAIKVTTLINPYLVITKEAPPTASPGQIITYLITIENWGDDWAYDIVVTETYPPGVTFISALPSPDIGNNVWLIPFLAPGGSGTIMLTVQISL